MRFNIGLAMSVVVAFCLNVQATEWETDFAKASTNAVKSGRHLLLDFCGSDWCGWCMKLDKEVFSEKAFRDYAATNLVLLLVDFPRRTAQAAEVAKQNRAMADQYGVEGFPTILLLDASGKELARTGYQPGGADAYVRHLRTLLEKH